MRVPIVSIVVAGLMVAARPLFAAPPDDLSAYCRATHGAVQFQVRCLYTEKAAKERLASTRASVTPDAWSRCESSSASWGAMESCLQPAAAGGATTSVGGGATGSPSTVILGPQGGSTAAAAEPNRVSRPVSEAEAERHLKGVLERSGEPQARCTKKQYSGGWVTVCE